MTIRRVPPRPITFSKNITIVPTHTCFKMCGYCEFRTSSPELISFDEVDAILDRALAYGCREVLVMSGEEPWMVPGFPLDADGFIEFVYEICLRALRKSLLPHTNIGLLTYEQLQRLKPVNASMGLMLETTNDNLIPAHHDGGGRWGNKRVADRVRNLEMAGELRIPFTTGLLIGIGESKEDRIESLHTISRIHEHYGHIQEIILQNFIPKPGTLMTRWPAASPEDMAETVRLAREIMPSMSIQIPPNLNPDFISLVQAGANDFGGISPEIDYVSPKYRWQPVDILEKEVQRIGRSLQERPAVYPEVDGDLQPVADTLRRESVGDTVSYSFNYDLLLPTKITVPWIERILADIAQSLPDSIGEISLREAPGHILELGDYLVVLRALRNSFPELPIRGLSPSQVHRLAEQAGTSTKEVLAVLHDHGLIRMDGLDAGLLIEGSRSNLDIRAVTASQWLEIMRQAHRLGIETSASIATSGDEDWSFRGKDWYQRIEHMEKIRSIQLDTGGFTEFVVLPFAHRQLPLGEVLKAIAYSRLFFARPSFGRIANIRSDPFIIGIDGLKQSLSWGANSFGPTSRDGQTFARAVIEAIIREAGRIPCQRPLPRDRQVFSSQKRPRSTPERPTISLVGSPRVRRVFSSPYHLGVQGAKPLKESST